MIEQMEHPNATKHKNTCTISGTEKSVIVIVIVIVHDHQKGNICSKTKITLVMLKVMIVIRV